MCQSIKHPKDTPVISVIDAVNEYDLVASIKVILGVKALVEVIMNFKGNDIKGHDDIVRKLEGRGSYNNASKNLDLNLMNKVTLLSLPFIDDLLFWSLMLIRHIFVMCF